MENFNIDPTSAIKSSNTALTISKKLYSMNKHIIEEDVRAILQKFKCNNIEEYFLKIFMLSTDIRDINSLIKNADIGEVIEYKNFSKELKSEYKALIQSFQRIINAHILEKTTFDTQIYMHQWENYISLI